MEQSIRLKYDGEGVREGQMDAYEVAGAIIGFTNLTTRVGRVLYGGNTELSATVTGFKQGTFNIDLLYSVVEVAGSILGMTGGSPFDFLQVIAECIEMLKHLKGASPNSIKKANDHSMYVENNHGNVRMFNVNTVNIVLDPATGRDAQKFAGHPLRRAAETLRVLANDREIAIAHRDEADSFVAIEEGEALLRHEVEMLLQIRTAVLEGKTKWKFHDGQKTFSAHIEDEHFLEKTSKGHERFGKGDTLRVRMRTTQRRVKDQLKAEYAIEEVLDHERLSDNETLRLF
jgi:hypothetical protein